MSNEAKQRLLRELTRSWNSFAECPSDKEAIRKLFAIRRRERISSQLRFLENTEELALQNIADGSQIDPYRVSPSLEAIKSPEGLAIFKYLCFTSSYAVTGHVGRCMKFLVRDEGQPGRPVMGVASLGSPVRNLAARDEYIGWNQKVELKASKLQHVMDLVTAISIPPYGLLLGGKLICLLMASNEVRELFRARYPKTRDLVLITTTSIFGKNSSQYNRLRIGQAKVYEYIGNTKGYGHIHISDHLFTRMQDYLQMRRIVLSSRINETHNWRMSVVSRAIRALGLPERKFLRHGLTKGIFVCPLARDTKQFLMNQVSRPEYMSASSSELIGFWKERWLGMRLKNQGVLRAVESWRKTSLEAASLLQGSPQSYSF